jgi:hypothetical protein
MSFRRGSIASALCCERCAVYVLVVVCLQGRLGKRRVVLE